MMDDYSFFPVGKSEQRSRQSAVKVRHPQGWKIKKQKINRALRKEIAESAEAMCKEGLLLMRRAKGGGKRSVSLFFTSAKGNIFLERDAKVIEMTARLIRKKKDGLKIKRVIRRIPICHNEEESDCVPDFVGGGYAAYLEISGFAK